MSPEVIWSSITYPREFAKVVSCFAKVLYFRNVAGAIFADSRFVRKTFTASAIVMRFCSGASVAAGSAGRAIYLAVP